MLVLACSLLGRPLHEAWHVAHPASERAGVAVLSQVAEASELAEVAANVALTDDASIDADGNDLGDPERKADACAWCLFHAQALATGHAPPSLLTHAEASPPPAALSDGWIASVDWTLAKPRGPPSA
ncbi:hypothetical protein [Roseateles sp.]|uniref:hypothetical protein n=1 Tax=Roseateles sp. TaxID=1971397 RepID=UPI0031D06B66